ncbi:PepSY domain-containing protein [Sphingorhabdus arenilitoris]|uniref:PepSY domain-containing protein n=1 Tax=Sphingorhabdus arenilitoris TaxID=1490041 RepID=A0ABV8RGD6_9SPHN
MRHYLILSICAAAAIATFSASPAHATGAITCKAGPESGWKPRAELEAKLKKEGWQIRKSKVDGGCYEVYGTTPEGQRVEAYFHPVSLEKLYVAQRGKVLFRKKGY